MPKPKSAIKTYGSPTSHAGSGVNEIHAVHGAVGSASPHESESPVIASTPSREKNVG